MAQIQIKNNDLGLTLHEMLMERSGTCAGRFGDLFLMNQPTWNSGLSFNEQIRLLNVFWRVQLGNCVNDTSRERGMLFDNIDPVVWLNNFKKHVLDTVVSQGLPNTPYTL